MGNQESQVGLQEGSKTEGVVPSNVADADAQTVPPVKRKRGRPRKIRPEEAMPSQVSIQDAGKEKVINR
ncbi:MAG: hypothetical protein WAX69_07365 [Victivallales bacterium]